MMSTARPVMPRTLSVAAMQALKGLPINPNGRCFMTVKARIRRGGAAAALAHAC